jgi:Putative Actinobacterial Holin-X, holin superfamily III
MQPVDPQWTSIPAADLPASDLVREAIVEARQLVRLEVELAKDEMKRELTTAKSAATSFAIGAIALIVGVALLFVALALAIFPGPIPALILGTAMLVGAVIAGAVGMRLLPKRPLAETRRRLEGDFDTAKSMLKGPVA